MKFYGLKPKLLFCLNVSALCFCHHLNHQTPILTVLSQRTPQSLWLECVLCFSPSCTITVSLLTNAFSSSLILLRSGSHKYSASSQPSLAIDDSNSHIRHELPYTLFCSQRLCIISLNARSPTITLPPCLHATQLLTHLFWLNKTLSSFNLYLAVISKPAQSLYSSPVVSQVYHLGYSCNSGIALPCKKTARLGQIEIKKLSPKPVLLETSQPDCISQTLILQKLKKV